VSARNQAQQRRHKQRCRMPYCAGAVLLHARYAARARRGVPRHTLLLRLREVGKS